MFLDVAIFLQFAGTNNRSYSSICFCAKVRTDNVNPIAFFCRNSMRDVRNRLLRSDAFSTLESFVRCYLLLKFTHVI